MKLSALAAQIKSCGHCEVINNGGRIFVGTGSAFYCMDGYPRTQDAGELGAMLGIPQKKMKNIFYHEECTIDGKLYGVSGTTNRNMKEIPLKSKLGSRSTEKNLSRCEILMAVLVSSGRSC